MAVKYVKDFSFPPSPPRPSVHGYARGGHVKASTPMPYASGGKVSTPFAYKNGGSLDIKQGVGKDVTKKVVGSGNVKTKPLSDTQRPPADKAKRVYDSTKVTAKAAGGYCAGGKGYAKGGKVADGKVPMGEKAQWNPDDAVSPGSPKRTPPKESKTNKEAAGSKFAADGRDTPQATEQGGDVQRMSGWSDFKSGGSASKGFDRLKNLGHYAHGGKVKASGEKASGTAGTGKVSAPEKPAKAAKYESSAGTPKTAAGSRVEVKSGTAKAAMGGLSRGTSGKRNAAIHAKSKKGPAGLAAVAGALSGMGIPHQGSGAPPGMAPGMGAPPGGMMGGIAPQAPTMGGGPPAMSHGGGVKSFTHVQYK